MAPHALPLQPPMTPSHTHDVLCIGSHDPHALEFHAANARAMRALFSGALGPPRSFVECICGPRVLPTQVDHAFVAIAARSAPNVVVFFSGKAGLDGLHLADATLDPRTLEAALASLPARNILLILDLDIGAELDAGLSPEWLRKLVARMPHVCAVVCRATRIGSGAASEGLARFTAALISALESTPGDVRFERARYISDKLAVEHVAKILSDRWGMTNLPVILGDLGEMPLTRSQAASAIGECTIASVKPAKGLSASVSWLIEGRANLLTTLHYALVCHDGTVVCEGSAPLVPTNPLQKGKTLVKFPKTALGTRKHAPRLDDLEWRVELLDSNHRKLATSVAKLARASSYGE